MKKNKGVDCVVKNYAYLLMGVLGLIVGCYGFYVLLAKKKQLTFIV